MRRATPRTTLVLGLLGLLLVAAASWVLLLGPATAELDEARTDLVDTTDVNRILSVQLRSLERQRDELAVTEALAADLQVVFPPTADQPEFFRLLDAAATSAGIDPDAVTTLSPTVPVTAVELAAGTDGATDTVPADVAVQTVTVTVEATYEQVQELLRQIEELDRAFLVQDVALATVDGTTTAQLVGTTFVAAPLEAPESER